MIRLSAAAGRPVACALLLGAALLPLILVAQQFDPSLYSGMRWRPVGPFRGGRVLAVTGVPGQPNLFYFGAVGGGVWKTTDAGRVWTPIFDSQPIASIGAIAVAPSDPKIIYVGSGEADMRSDISYGNGMYKSTDGGDSWTHIGLEDSRQIGRIRAGALTKIPAGLRALYRTLELPRQKSPQGRRI